VVELHAVLTKRGKGSAARPEYDHSAALVGRRCPSNPQLGRVFKDGAKVQGRDPVLAGRAGERWNR
jgi:hypothetical protein